jgi:hypothetical protein
VKTLRRRSLNVTEAGANLASDLQRLVQRVVNMEQRKLRRSLPSRVRRRSRNVVARQHDNEARSKLQGKVNIIRHRVTINVYDSARRRLWPQVNGSSVAQARRQDLVNRSGRRLVAGPQVKHAVKGKECKAHMVNRPRNSSSSRSRATPRPQPITAKDKGNRRVGNKKDKNQHRRRGHNNLAKPL